MNETLDARADASAHVRLTREEAKTYRLDVLEVEIREAIEYDLSDFDPVEGPPTDAQIEWAKETAERIARSWSSQRDGYVEYALEVQR